MTITSELSRVVYATDGVTDTFSVPFRFLAASHLRVIELRNDVPTLLTLGLHYSVAGVNQPTGGSVTLNTAPGAGGQLAIVRVVPLTQETAYPKNDPFPEAAHERALDKLTMIAQQLDSEIARAVNLAQVALENSSVPGSPTGIPESIDAKATQALTVAASAQAIATSAQATATDAQASADAAQSAALAAQAAASAWPAMPLLIKADYNQPCLFKVTATSLRIRAGTSLVVDGNLIAFANDTNVAMPTLQAGTDYSVWVRPDGTAVAVKDMFASPASAPAAGARKIGGFHFGLVASGTTVAAGGFAASTGTGAAAGGMIWTQAQVNDIAGINKYSIWDVHFRSAGEQHGFAFDPQTRVWVAIYLCGKFHDADGISAYNKTVASGTVLPRIPAAYRNGTSAQTYASLTGVVAMEIAASHGARLPRVAEFFSAAWGATEGQSMGGAAATIPLTKREPGYTSRIGLEQATGHLWVWGDTPANYGDGGWYTLPGGRGCAVGALAMSRLGGARTAGTYSGSRSNYGANGYAHSDWATGLRAVCDHYQVSF